MGLLREVGLLVRDRVDLLDQVLVKGELVVLVGVVQQLEEFEFNEVLIAEDFRVRYLQLILILFVFSA